MARSILISSRQFAPGTYSANVAVPGSTKTIVATLDKSSWPNTPLDVIRLRQRYSGDNGNTWFETEWVGFPGAPLVKRGGGLLTEVSFAMAFYFAPGVTPYPWCDPANGNRRVGLEVEVLQTLRTALSVEFLNQIATVN